MASLCRDTKPSHFFAINFELAIQSLDAFKFFVALFNPAAFVRDAQGKCRLDYVRESALAAQSKLEEDSGSASSRLSRFSRMGSPSVQKTKSPMPISSALRYLFNLSLSPAFHPLCGRPHVAACRAAVRKYYKDFSLAALRSFITEFF